MTVDETLHKQIETDMWTWIHEFVTVPNSFYEGRFAPCPYARAAVIARTVDLAVWTSGDVRTFIRSRAEEVRDTPDLTTRVMVFPPRVQFAWGISDWIEMQNADLIPDNIFLNPGIAKTTTSRYPNSPPNPYFMVVANSLAPVLAGARSLAKSNYYKDWPQEHYALVVERRARLAALYGRKPAVTK